MIVSDCLCSKPRSVGFMRARCEDEPREHRAGSMVDDDEGLRQLNQPLLALEHKLMLDIRWELAVIAGVAFHHRGYQRCLHRDEHLAVEVRRARAAIGAADEVDEAEDGGIHAQHSHLADLRQPLQ